MLEPYEGKLSHTVLRGESHGNVVLLPDLYSSRYGHFEVNTAKNT